MKWISIKEKRPDADQWCWVFGKVDAEHNCFKKNIPEDYSVEIAQFQKDERFWFSSNCCQGDCFVYYVEWYIPLDKPNPPKD